MAPKSTTKSAKSLPIEFVNWELTKEEKIAAKDYKLTMTQVFQALERLVTDGFRVSWKRDDYNKCFNCSITEPMETASNSVRCIVSRGPTLEDACRVASFKHFVLLEGDWGKLSSTSVERDVWG